MANCSLPDLLDLENVITTLVNIPSLHRVNYSSYAPRTHRLPWQPILPQYNDIRSLGMGETPHLEAIMLVENHKREASNLGTYLTSVQVPERRRNEHRGSVEVEAIPAGFPWWKLRDGNECGSLGSTRLLIVRQILAN